MSTQHFIAKIQTPAQKGIVASTSCKKADVKDAKNGSGEN